MKMLAGYLLAIALIVGGYLGALGWLTTEPATSVAHKSQPSVAKVIAKAEAEPVKAAEEVVTFPEAPPRPALVTEAADQSAQTPTPQTKSAVVPSGPSPTSTFAQFQPEPGKTVKPPVRTASKKKAKPRYEVMIQRTVQMPDGRIVQKLIPLSRKEADAYAQYR